MTTFRSKRTASPRPFATYYYHGLLDDEDDFTAHGCCSTDEGAQARAVVKVWLHKYAKAIIYNRDTGADPADTRADKARSGREMGKPDNRLSEESEVKRGECVITGCSLVRGNRYLSGDLFCVGANMYAFNGNYSNGTVAWQNDFCYEKSFQFQPENSGFWERRGVFVFHSTDVWFNKAALEYMGVQL